MKTGVIVYVLGNEDNHQDTGRNMDINTQVKKLGVDADRVELVSEFDGQFDIPYAWWSLTVKGMHRIICKMARLTQAGELQFTGHELRLCG